MISNHNFQLADFSSTMSSQHTEYAQLCRQMREFQRNTLHYIHGSIKLLDNLLDNHEYIFDDESFVSDETPLESLSKVVPVRKATVRKSRAQQQDAATQTKPPRVRKPKAKLQQQVVSSPKVEKVIEYEEENFSFPVLPTTEEKAEMDMAELLG